MKFRTTLASHRLGDFGKMGGNFISCFPGLDKFGNCLVGWEFSIEKSHCFIIGWENFLCGSNMGLERVKK